MTPKIDSLTYLPSDGFTGTLVGRAWIPVTLTGTVAVPCTVIVTSEGVYYHSRIAPTTADLLNNHFSRT